MADLTPEVLENVLKKVLTSESMVGIETHNDHHEWIKENKPFLAAYVRKEERKQQQWEKIKGSVIIALILGTGTVVYNFCLWIWRHIDIN